MTNVVAQTCGGWGRALDLEKNKESTVTDSLTTVVGKRGVEGILKFVFEIKLLLSPVSLLLSPVSLLYGWLTCKSLLTTTKLFLCSVDLKSFRKYTKYRTVFCLNPSTVLYSPHCVLSLYLNWVLSCLAGAGTGSHSSPLLSHTHFLLLRLSLSRVADRRWD